ncbi:hypothetical protein BLS_001591 [Venturia inaequalis]|uniref:CDP-diacylglycerol--glycerol-3-phosphate 3-phosphatidyltransferase n=1 Tax=Venturia inaequalis TaxID=5025 RepID=A0A8H3Z7Q6_VENIN|nr:hypothetical protein BLS_001591 [Venturia inaequalis]KAE9986258.1 hypothetical protein EG328_006261 [Venturia inaequalis]KAE9991938.1 hypothetical protein EG327_010616 [Venturia inaequalis]RDI79822.1 hypothetical protein Vi05172_g10166 [Venturia inaequalis]
MLGSVTSELDKLSPRFEVEPSQIRILKSPGEFYDTLKISTIRDALKRNPELKVSILTDALRGTRETPKPCCASLLVPLVEEFGENRVEIRMFHTPNLTGLRKKVVPKRINEGWGLQHMKLYAIDDELIMSGANLSTDYFTNRQDRYHVFSSAAITDYFERIHQAVCKLSFSILPSKELAGYTMEWRHDNPGPSPLLDPKAFSAQATASLDSLLHLATFAEKKPPSTSTLVYPLLQFTPLLRPDTSTELPAVRTILSALSTPVFAKSSWTFTAGYFNMTPEVRGLLLNSNPARATVISASPWANGFYGSKGVSGMLPAAYSLLSRRFLDAVSSKSLSSQITLKEWRRGTVDEPGGWTYHAKGLWVTMPNETQPSISLVGSSNYTKRSYSLDLEANVLIVTRDQDLMKRLGEEEQWLQEYAKPVDRDEFAKTERRVGLHVRVAMWLVTVLGGAL